MSEYQYYEFQAIDRPLTEEEQAAIDKLSSRVDLSPTQASFVYNYSDFPGDAEAILARYFDAMLYMANWGTCQLMFRFPKNAIDLAQTRAYCPPPSIDQEFIGEFMSFTEQGEYIILNIEWHEEGGWDWIEGNGWLPRMIGLREEVLRGDYRLLYLAWLKAIALEAEIEEAMLDEIDEMKEPPVPPGLRQLSPGLRAFSELFELDKHLVAAAAEASGSPVGVTTEQLRQAIGQLAPETREAWLLRLAQGEEPQLSVAFNQALLKLMDLPQQDQPAQRTVGDLLAAAKRIKKEAQARRAEAARVKHLKKMETLATQETEIWQAIIDSIERKTAAGYDQALEHLTDLRDLAKHQGEAVTFQSRVNKLYRDYSNRPALIRRLRKAKLVI